MGYVPPLAPGLFIRALRTFCGLSRSELARRTGIHPTRIALLEEAVGRPTVEELDTLWCCFASNAPPVPEPDPPLPLRTTRS